MRVDRARLVRLALAGLMAGIVIFAIFNPGIVREEAKIPRLDSEIIFDFDKLMQAAEDMKKYFQTPDPFGAFMFTGAFAAMVGGFLVIADGMSLSTKRVILKAIFAAVVGIAIGGISGVLIDLIVTWLARIQLIFILLGQPLGWVLIGGAAGASIGLTLGSWKRARLAIIGGLVGGFLGGMIFEGIGGLTSTITSSGSFGRFFGFAAMGAVIGIAVSFVEDMAKRNWVVVLTGAKEGMQFILSKPITSIGKDEYADIPLFGDTNVAKHHADIIVQGHTMVTIKSTGGEVEVNGSPTPSVELKDSDVISIGRHRLRFHQKALRGRGMQPYAQPDPGAHVPQASYPPAQTMVQPMVVPATGNITLRVISGPHMGQVFQFGSGSIRIGREVGCAINLAWDTVVSRHHAEILWNGTGWVARDLGSTNGLWINGVRISEHVLRLGDQIGIGQTWLRVEGI